MARIFAGNEALVDPDVLEAVKRLSNDFFVFAEFDIDRRNIDWLIIRIATGTREDLLSSAAILTEMKRISAPITGTVQDEWKVERIDGTVEAVGAGQEKNPYWQAVAAANALRSWLWNHHKLFCDDGADAGELQESNFSVWPDVLILPRRDQVIEHRLPVRPTNGFGMWWFELDRWLQHVTTWRPNQRDRTRRFSERELVRLAELLDTHEIHRGEATVPEAPRQVANGHHDLEASFNPMLAYLRRLESQIAELRQRVSHLEARGIPAEPLDAVVPHPSIEIVVQDAPDVGRVGSAALLPREHAAIVSGTARAFAMSGRRAVFPAVLKDVERQLGVSLKQSQYQGFGSARAYFDQAREQRLIEYGPLDESGAPTILPIADAAVEETGARDVRSRAR
ncbi:MAG: hypothetical protein ACRDHN_01830 [Thermomicrobiales bacterium]